MQAVEMQTGMHCKFPPAAVMPRAYGASSTLRLLRSSTGASGILGRPVKPGDDNRAAI